MDFDNPKVCGDTFITDGLVSNINLLLGSATISNGIFEMIHKKYHTVILGGSWDDVPVISENTPYSV